MAELAKLRMITSDDEMVDFFMALRKLKDRDDNVIKRDEYVSPLTDDDCVNLDNMKFDNAGTQPNANLLIWKSQGGKCYTLAYYTTKDELRMILEDELKSILGDAYLASGTGCVNADDDGNTTNISLTLTGATKQLRFDNQNIVQITDSSGNDEIRINTQGVATNAELDFSKGEADTDTIYLNGETTVNNIRGGGKQQYTYSSA